MSHCVAFRQFDPDVGYLCFCDLEANALYWDIENQKFSSVGHIKKDQKIVLFQVHHYYAIFCLHQRHQLLLPCFCKYSFVDVVYP